MVASSIPLTPEQIKQKLIENGLASIEKDERLVRVPYKLEGSREGFRLCYDLNTPEDFQRCLKQRKEESRQLAGKGAAYWRHRFATVQIEVVWETMRIVWELPGPKSAMAGIRLGLIMGYEIEGFSST